MRVAESGRVESANPAGVDLSDTSGVADITGTAQKPGPPSNLWLIGIRNDSGRQGIASGRFRKNAFFLYLNLSEKSFIPF